MIVAGDDVEVVEADPVLMTPFLLECDKCNLLLGRNAICTYNIVILQTCRLE